ncbi:hypothetical protein Hypma_002744 [Hypsizygus marmoreus]|uniref:Uncharacterized protein n=1 Tax=Hypsizygus marmoreus TaxID=39966 RepID=A0A369JCH3_HYPMA|nr:hypothetical protein Hypma_002744 [Hypsizygus marmoreus]
MTEYNEFPNREPSFHRSMDPAARDAVRRSMTRNSHYSHVSVSPSTRSWVYSNQQHPPPPPEEVTPVPSPVRTARPLPDPQLQPQNQQSALRITNDIEPVDDEEEYMNIDANAPGLESGYQTEGMGRGKSPRIVAASSGLERWDGSSPGGRSFVGGFFHGLRRLPKVVMKYGSTGEKRKFPRRGTFGTEGTVTSATGMTTGNTLPRYASNPPTPIAGPSNVQYVQATEMPVPFPADAPPILGPSLSQRRRHPSFRITPPSEGVAEPQRIVPLETPQFADAVVESPRNANTVTVYNIPQDEAFGHEDMPVPITGPVLPTPTPNRRSDSQHVQSVHPSVHDANPIADLSQSPVTAHPLPAADYRKMTLSTSPTSPTTLTTDLTSEPSFSSQLNPVKRFFQTLYRMPWIAQERVTVDYRPRGRGQGVMGARGITKRSWYRGTPGVVLSGKTGSGDLDLLSSATGSRRASTNTASTPRSPLMTHEAARVRHRPADHRHRHTRHRASDNTQERGSREYRRRHRNTTSTGTGTPAEMMQHQRNTSPIIPAVYPYSYQYPFPFPVPSAAPERTHSHSTPRGPRSHRTPTYPHGYAPYQPPPAAPPMYVIQSPAQTNASGESPQTQGQGQITLSPVYVPMSLVPGTFTPDSAPGNLPSASPPATAATAAQT